MNKTTIGQVLFVLLLTCIVIVVVAVLSVPTFVWLDISYADGGHASISVAITERKHGQPMIMLKQDPQNGVCRVWPDVGLPR